MSQAKVDKYKQEKVNRKEIMAKEKRQKLISKVCITAVLVVIGAWMAVGVGEFVYESRPKDTIYVQTTELDNYIESLNAEETTDK